MGARLAANQYGKAEVRVVKVTRGPGRHLLRDLTASIGLRGAFEAVHVEGDNTGLPATDTMRNVVYAFAADDALDSLPAFGARLAEHFTGLAPVSGATVTLQEHPWERLDDAAWRRGAGGTRVHVVEREGTAVRHTGGLDDLLVLRSSGSGFAGFDRDRYTTLPETDDRILATVVTARWDHAAEPAEDAWAAIRDTLLAAFTDHFSPSVQFTLHEMATAVIERHADVERIHLTLPNRHHLPFDVARFGVKDRKEVFHATTEPHGIIEALIERV